MKQTAKLRWSAGASGLWPILEQTARAGSSIGHHCAPVIDLLIRLWLAQAFLVIDLERAMATSGSLAGGGAALVLRGVTGSGVGVAFEAACPFLLAFGLGTRVAAFALLAQLLALTPKHNGISLAPCWSVLLGWLIVTGAGTLSVDWLVGGGVRASALPFARVLSDWTTRASRLATPCMLLLIRLWIALLPAALSLSAMGHPDLAHMAPDSAWLPLAPSTFDRLPAAVTLLFAILVALGLLTRAFGLALLLSALPDAYTATNGILWWSLLLALPVLHGPGPLSIDHWMLEAVRRRGRDAAAARIALLGRLPHVVVVGGGFGGLAVARSLHVAPCRITVVDANNYHLFQPLLYQVATAGLSPADIATPIREVFRDQENVRVLLGTVTAVEHKARRVVIGAGTISYDFLVLATGARHSYFGRDEWANDAPGLKSIEDALGIRRRLLLAFEEAEVCEDPAVRAALLTFVIVGGGPTGVELAGALAELAREGLAREFRTIDPADARVILVQSGPVLLPTFPPALSRAAALSLEALDVEVRTGARITSVDEGGVAIGDDRVAARTILWAAGVMASDAARWLGAATDRSGRVIVGPDLSVAGHDDVFAVGDVAASDAWHGMPVPGLAPAAKQGGQYVARVIAARLAGQPAPPRFRYRHLGSLATIGRRSAVADFGPLRVSGAPAWWLWGAAHVTFLVGTRNRASVIVEWIWAYLTLRRSTRLITRTGAIASVRTEPALER